MRRGQVMVLVVLVALLFLTWGFVVGRLTAPVQQMSAADALRETAAVDVMTIMAHNVPLVSTEMARMQTTLSVLQAELTPYVFSIVEVTRRPTRVPVLITSVPSPTP